MEEDKELLKQLTDKSILLTGFGDQSQPTAALQTFTQIGQQFIIQKKEIQASFDANRQYQALLEKDEFVSSFEQLKNILQNCYQQQSKVPLLLDETKLFALDEIFIDLELIKKTEETNSTQNPMISNDKKQSLIEPEERPELQTFDSNV